MAMPDEPRPDVRQVPEDGAGQRAVGPPASSTSPSAPDQIGPSSRPAQQWAARPDGYSARLFRRIVSAVVYIVVIVVTTRGAVFTAVGQAWDTALMETLATWRPTIAPVGRILVHLASWQAVVVMCVVVAVVAIARRRWHLAVRAVIVVVAANLTTQLVKLLIVRPDLGSSIHIANSLPSGHTTFAASIALALVIVAPRWVRTPAAYVGWIWTTLMAMTVIMYGWHRPSDVLVAVLVAGTWAQLLAPVEHRRRHGVMARRMLSFFCGCAIIFALLIAWYFMPNVDIVSHFAPGAWDMGYAQFVASDPARTRWLALAVMFMLSGVAGAVMCEVDRLSWAQPQSRNSR